VLNDQLFHVIIFYFATQYPIGNVFICYQKVTDHSKSEILSRKLGYLLYFYFQAVYRFKLSFVVVENLGTL
jgi:hypothetical protein